MTNPSRVAILDAGGQYVDLVRKAVQRQGNPADILPLNTPLSKIEGSYGAIIMSGSPASTRTEAAPQPDNAIWSSSLPILGICYGLQAMVIAHGGKVIKNAIREDGRITTKIDTTHLIFKGIKKDFTGLFTHGDFVKSIPDGFATLGSHKLTDGSIAYSAVGKDNKIGVQFHPEVFDDTPDGYQLFKNFLELIAGLKADKKFQQKHLQEVIISKQQQIMKKVGNRHVIAFVSGGVDSSVATMLAAQVIPAERLHAFYIDSGFMRDEDDMVIETLKAAGMLVKKIDAARDFEKGNVKINGHQHGPLNTVTDPEIKRKIIGKVFVRIQSRLLKELELTEAFLLQGTNAADRIESGHSIGDSHTMTIKTHHNQVKEIQELKAAGLLIEPLDDLFKDEVRELGHELGLPHELVQRQPFPGPGTAIRIIAAKTDNHKVLPGAEQPAAQILLDKLKIDSTVHLLPIRSVGVGGDARSHLSVAAIDNAKLDANQLSLLGSHLPAHFRETINRVIYALGAQPLNNLSVTKTLLTNDARSQLRQADKIVFEEMRLANLMVAIKQFPVILIPLSFGGRGQRSIVLRPITTSTFMTVQAMLPTRDLPTDFLAIITKRILSEVPGISQVFLDLTNKPPATTEWE